MQERETGEGAKPQAILMCSQRKKKKKRVKIDCLVIGKSRLHISLSLRFLFKKAGKSELIRGAGNERDHASCTTSAGRTSIDARDEEVLSTCCPISGERQDCHGEKVRLRSPGDERTSATCFRKEEIVSGDTTSSGAPQGYSRCNALPPPYDVNYLVLLGRGRERRFVFVEGEIGPLAPLVPMSPGPLEKSAAAKVCGTCIPSWKMNQGGGLGSRLPRWLGSLYSLGDLRKTRAQVVATMLGEE